MSLLLTLSLGLKGFTHGSLSSKQILLNSSSIWSNVEKVHPAIHLFICPFTCAPTHLPVQLICRTVQILGIVRAWSNYCIVSPVPCQKLRKITCHWSNQVTRCLILLITRNKYTVVPLLNNTKCYAITFIPRTCGSFYSHTWSKSARGLFCLTGASGSYVDKREQPEP